MARAVVILWLVAAAAAGEGCHGTDASPGRAPYSRDLIGQGVAGVDLLVVVDDSSGMGAAQANLATAIVSLVEALSNPVRTDFPETNWPFSAVDALRVAVVTSNMGLSSDGVVNDSYWPGGDAPAGCHDLGDNGAFQGIGVASVAIADDAILCDATGVQCPPGWTCEGIGADAGVGSCHSDGAPEIACPGLEATWAEASWDFSNPDIAEQASCLTQQGIAGCGWEQPLAAAAAALTRNDQVEFLGDADLLAVLVVSDEDDCSLEDGQGMFATEEIADQSAMKANIACGEHQEFLFSPERFYDAFSEAAGWYNVVFAAIVGVPNQGAGGAACQGRGDQLTSCFDQDVMLDIPQQVDGTWFYAPACTNPEASPGGTVAEPGGRYVVLARDHFADAGYVSSICNADWSPAMAEFARMIGERTSNACFPHRLEWDSAREVAVCDVVAVLTNPEVERCPEALGGAVPIIEQVTSSEGEVTRSVYCAIPKLASALECAEQTQEQEDAFETELGWYYCEHSSGGGDLPTCDQFVGLTRRARDATAGLPIMLQCLQ
jgi:hypothetical protein